MEGREMVNVNDEVPFGADVDSLDLYAHMDDMEANDCIRKIGNWERYRSFWLDYYQKKIDEVNAKCDRNIAYQQRNLRDFFETVPHRSTKTMEAYDLPSGRISVSYAKPKLVPNRKAILERFAKSGDREFIKVEEKLDWDGYKDRLFISDTGDVLDKETGEIISDVAVEVTEPSFSVKINDKGDD